MTEKRQRRRDAEAAGGAMRPGMQSLLDLLRRECEDAERSEAEWKDVLALAEQEHILPWAARLLSRRRGLPAQLCAHLQTIEREAAIAAFCWTAELTRILSAFNGRELRVVPLKGPFLAERLYRDTALRASYDLDLLVSRADVEQAERVLSGLGFAPGTPDEYHRQWYRGPTTVELHHDVENPLAFNFHTESALERAQPASFGGQPCSKLAPDDELLFLCLHGVRHRFERLSLLLDLSLAFQRLGAREPIGSSGEVAERGSLLTIGWRMAALLDPDRVPPLPELVSREHRLQLEQVASRLWHDLLVVPAETLDWRAAHAFYLEIEEPRRRMRRRVNHLRILLARTIEPDYRFAARWGLHRAWQVRLLRPLRLLWELTCGDRESEPHGVE
ncbi:MAG: nucleotidyltransferase family protein [Acidobacteriota bacterium]|nr:nucleotidyltransferase family protein [Acidobacteriota bacterium]